MKKKFSWFIESNRLKHLAAGAIITATTSLLTAFFVCDLCLIANNCFYVSLVAGLSVEYKDHLYGNKFDWLDVLSTVLPSLGFFIGIIVAELL